VSSLFIRLSVRLLLGQYPHVTAPLRPSGLTQQEMQAAAVAAAEQGYYDREYYVDEGQEHYYGEEYDDSCVGGAAEGIYTATNNPRGVVVVGVSGLTSLDYSFSLVVNQFTLGQRMR